MSRLSNSLALISLATSLALAAGPVVSQAYDIEVQSGGVGSVTPSGIIQVPAGGSQTFTFAPGAGNVANVTIDDVIIGSGLTEYTFTNVQSDHLLYVSFGPPMPPPPPPAPQPQPLFSPPFRSYGTGSTPSSVAIADLNADGHADLVTANAGSSSVSVLLGYGGGGFGSQTTFATGDGPRSVVIADMNGDGRPDLATANYSSNTVSVLLGNGDGTFGPRRDFATGTHPGAMAAADLDGDGQLDLVVANEGSNTVWVLLGNGDGTWHSRAFAAGVRPTSVAIADLNGDGRYDLVVTNIGPTGPEPPWPPCESCHAVDSSYVSILLGNGDGTFVAGSRFACGEDPRSIAIGDVNADGRPDLATANVTPGFENSISVFMGLGDGTFGGATYYATSIAGFSVAIADLDGDRRPDLVATTNEGVSFFQGNGDGSFGSPGSRVDFGGFGPGFGVWQGDLALGDLNGDGHPDLAVAGGLGGNSVAVLVHNTDPTRTTTAMTLSGSPDRAEPGQSMSLSASISPQPSAGGVVRFFDVTFGVTNGAVEVGSAPVVLGVASFTYGPLGTNRTVQARYDGDTQYAGCVSNPVSIDVFVGAGMFSQPTLFDAGSSPVSVLTSDLNADGRPDLVVANSSSSMVSVLLGAGGGSFHGLDFDTGAIMSTSVAIGDLNGDGRPDLVTANPDMSTAGGNAVSVLLGHGDGTFEPRTIYPAGTNAASVAIADLNGDGRPDIVAADSYPNTVSVLLGNGDGTFGPKTTFPAGYEPQCVAVADLNADGRMDLVLADTGANTVTVLLGNGDGTFGPGTDYTTGYDPYSVAIADLNGDGRPDLVAANGGSGTGNTVSVLLGNGDGSFGPKTDFVTGSYPVSVTIGDIDADGWLDLVIANRGSNTVSVLLGNGDGTFRAKRDYRTGATSPFSVAIADFNGDIRPDLAVVNSERTPGKVSVLFQTDVVVAALLARFDATTVPLGIELRWSFGDRRSVAAVAVERATAITGPWHAIVPERRDESGVTVALDRTADASEQYFYRLVMQLTSGGQAVSSAVSASRRGTPSKTDLTLLSANPSSRGAQVQYSVARAGRVRVEVLDVAGRVEATLADRIQAPGRYVVDWDSVGRRAVSPGLHFIRLVTPDRMMTKKLAIIR